jgi:colicin import membrane protein
MTYSKLSKQLTLLVGALGVAVASLSLCAHAQPSGVENALTLAQSSIAKRDWDGAERILLPLSKSQPNNPFVFYEMAQVYENTSRVDAAKQIYQSIASIPDAEQRQYTVVYRSPNLNYMTSLVALSQAKLNALNVTASAKATPIVAARAVTPVAVTPVAAEPTPAVTSSNAADDVTAAMQKWARSWANKDLNGYFASYVPGFQGDKGSNAAWKKFRNNYINSKKSIALDLADIQVTTTAADKAQVTFKQSYTSDSYNDVTTKTMNWVKQGNAWLIERESATK